MSTGGTFIGRLDLLRGVTTRRSLLASAPVAALAVAGCTYGAPNQGAEHILVGNHTGSAIAATVTITDRTTGKQRQSTVDVPAGGVGAVDDPTLETRQAHEHRVVVEAAGVQNTYPDWFRQEDLSQLKVHVRADGIEFAVGAPENPEKASELG